MARNVSNKLSKGDARFKNKQNNKTMLIAIHCQYSIEKEKDSIYISYPDRKVVRKRKQLICSRNTNWKLHTHSPAHFEKKKKESK